MLVSLPAWAKKLLLHRLRGKAKFATIGDALKYACG
jgi:hypothetical protein